MQRVQDEKKRLHVNFMPCRSSQEVPKQDEEESDPGMIFLLNDPAQVDACVRLAGAIDPPIQPGKNNIWLS